MTGALVPLLRIRFGGGRRYPNPPAVLAFPAPPRSTTDYRYPFCHEHHLACDCREAELAEQLAEYRYELTELRKAIREHLAGHRVHDHMDDCSSLDMDREQYDRAMRGDGPLACQCSGCRLVRDADAVRVADTDDRGIVLASGDTRW